MQFTLLFLTLTTTLLSITKPTHAACFETGVSWSSIGTIYPLELLVRVCDEIVGEGSFAAGEKRHRCRPVSMGEQHVDYTVTRISGTAGVLTYGDCWDGLQKEIVGCSKGGSSSYSNWKYTSDPNDGPC